MIALTIILGRNNITSIFYMCRIRVKYECRTHKNNTHIKYKNYLHDFAHLHRKITLMKKYINK